MQEQDLRDGTEKAQGRHSYEKILLLPFAVGCSARGPRRFCRADSSRRETAEQVMAKNIKAQGGRDALMA